MRVRILILAWIVFSFSLKVSAQTVTLGNVSSAFVGTTVLVPISMANFNQLVSSMQFTIEYDNEVLRYDGVTYLDPTDGWASTTNPGGMLTKISFVNTPSVSFTTPRTILNLQFTVKKACTGIVSFSDIPTVKGVYDDNLDEYLSVNWVSGSVSGIIGVGTISHPTCEVPTGGVVLNGLPATGTWTLTRTPGAITTTGTGTSTTITGLSAGTYTYTVTDGITLCTSIPSANIVINEAPGSPTAPIVGTIVHPTCGTSTGSVVLSGLPATGTWTLTRTPGSITTTGTGTSTTITGLSSGTYTYTVTDGITTCVSSSSGNVIINAQPLTPVLVTGTITNPSTCGGNGSIVLNFTNVSNGTYTISYTSGSFAGVTVTGGTATISAPAGTYNNLQITANTCTSATGVNASLTDPAKPTAPVVGTIVHPTCGTSTGSVVLSGLPATGTWTLTRTPGSITTTGTGTSTTITGLSAGTYTYTVTNGITTCVSSSSGNVIINAQPLTPVLVTGTITNPSACGGNGSIVLNFTNVANGTYTISYTSGSFAGVTVTGGTATISAPAGTYNNLQITANTCTSATGVNASLTDPAKPTAPVVGTIVHPTCGTSTGSVVLSGLPATGTWTLTRTPGSITTTGTGTSTTITGLSSGTYTYTVTDGITTCVSSSSGNVIINAQPLTPVLVTGTITNPSTCGGNGSIVLNFTNVSNGTYTISYTSGSFAGVTVTGGTATISAPAGTYNNLQITANTCTSATGVNASLTDPAKPTAPVVGTIVHPTCGTSTGSVVLSGLPATGTWTLTRTPGSITTTGTGTSTTITGLSAGTYTYTVTNGITTCVSSSSGNVIINAQPPTPIVPIQTIAILAGETFTVTPNDAGIPVGTTYKWTAPTYVGGVTGGSEQTIPQLSIVGTLTIPSGNGSATYTVTPNSGSCVGTPFTLVVFVSSTCSPVIINTDPADNSMCATVGNALFTVVPVGTSPFTFQWQSNNSGTWANVTNGIPAGALYTNANTATLNVAGITAAGSTQYRCYVTNCSGSLNATSNFATLNVNALPTAPIVGTIVHPTCGTSTGSVVLSGLPATGTWTLTRTPGSITTTGTGTSTTITGLSSGTYTYTVTDGITTCVSSSSGNVIINAQPLTPVLVTGTITNPSTCGGNGSIVLNFTNVSNGTYTISYTSGSFAGVTVTGGTATISAPAGTYNNLQITANTCTSATGVNASLTDPAKPTAPVVGTIVHPTCGTSTGSVVLSGLPATGTWTLTRTPGSITTTGTGTSTTITGLSAGTYTYTVTNGITTCVSSSSGNVIINAQPLTPVLVTGTITNPSACGGNGSIVLNFTNVANGTYTISYTSGSFAGVTVTGGTATISAPAGTYNNLQITANTCTSATGVNASLTDPAKPTAPVVGTIVHPTCGTSTGSVVLSGLPATGTWTLTRTPGSITTTGTGTSTTITGLSAGTYTYTVTDGITTCVSSSSGNVIINAQPLTPVLVTGTITNPSTCGGNGSIVLNFTNVSNGTYTISYTSGSFAGVTVTGGTATISAPAGTYNNLQITANTCTSATGVNASLTDPAKPTAPVVGTIVHPTCGTSTGSVVLSGLPATGTWTLTRTPGSITTTGTGTSTTITGLSAGTYTYTVTNGITTCVSSSSGNVIINAQPPTPIVPIQTIAILAGETFTVTPNDAGIPVGTTYKWTAPTYVGGVTGGSEQTIPQLSIVGTLTIPSGNGSATYTVTPNSGSCVGTPFTLVVFVSSTCSPVIINTDPADNSMCATVGNALFTVVPVGTSPFTFQWQSNNSGTWANVTNGIPAGALYTNANTATLNVAGITAAGSTQYRCYVTNCSGSLNATSNFATLNVNALPTAPIVGTIVHPTCGTSTGSVVLSGLPATGTWTLTRTPGSITTTGTGTSTTITGLSSGTYTYTVTDGITTCVSSSSGNVIINAQPLTPVLVTGTITNPSTCGGNGSIVLNFTNVSNGTYTISYTSGSFAGVTVTGGTATISAPAGTYNNLQITANTCTSATGVNASLTDPAKPTAPIVGTIVHPTCGTSTGSVVLSGLPSTGTWTLTRTPGSITTTGTGTSRTITGLSAGTYTYTVTNGITTCVSSSSGNVIINAQPPTPIVNDEITSMLSGLSFTVTPLGVPAGTIYKWAVPTYTGGVTGGIAQLTGQTNISGSLTIPSGTGTAVYTVTPSSGTCIGATFTVTVTVYSNCIPVSIETQPVDNSMCTTSGTSSFTVVASGSGPFTYQWQYKNGAVWSTVSNGTPAGAIYTSTATASINVSGISTAGNYLYRCYITNCSGSTNATSTEAVLTVNPLPGTPVAGTITQPTCALPSGSVILNNLPAGNWTINPGAITGSTPSTTISDLAPGTYSFIVSNGTCTSLPSTNVVIQAVPAKPNAPGVGTLTQPTCALATGSVILTGLPSGSWIINPGSITGSGSTYTVSGLATGTYNFTVTNSIGCTSILTSNVVINAQPVTPSLIITNPDAVCSPSKVDLTGSAVTEGSTSGLTLTYWTNSAASNGYSTPSSAAAGTYYIKGTASSGCFEIKPVVATVIPLPTANAGTGGNECDLDFTFNAVASIGTGTWSKTSGPGTATFTPNANTATATVAVSSYGTYVFTWTEVSNGCSKSASVTVIFNQRPVANSGSGGNTCGLTFTFSAVASIGTGTWTKTSGAGTASFSPNINSPTARVTVTSYGDYSFTWTEANSNCTSSSTVNIKFLEVPVANAGVDGSDCDLDFVLNAVPGTGSSSGIWTKLNGPGNAIFSPDPNQPGAKVTVDQYGTYEFTWSEQNGICLSSDKVKVVFHSPPHVSAGNDTEICIGSSVQLSASGVGTFKWNPSTFLNSSVVHNPVATPEVLTSYTVTLTDQYGCINTDAVTIDVLNNPVSNAGNDIELDYILGTELSANYPGINETGTWSVVSGTGDFTDNTDPLTEVKNLTVGENIFLWRVTNNVCPPSDDNVTVLVRDLVIPTLITPNMDGKNDYFILKGIETLGKTELVIFDRRGAQVYKNSNYNNTWNGVDYNENPLPNDTYFFNMKTESGKTLKGYVVIRR